MNPQEITAYALLLLLGVMGMVLLSKAFNELGELQRSQKELWAGIIGRGFIGARRKGFLRPKEGCEVGMDVMPAAREVYEPVIGEMQRIYRETRQKKGRDLLDPELTQVLEEHFQPFMLSYACPSLGTNDYECLAIAAVLARELPSEAFAPKERGAPISSWCRGT